MWLGQLVVMGWGFFVRVAALRWPTVSIDLLRAYRLAEATS
jgi:hypothetical protein